MTSAPVAQTTAAVAVPRLAGLDLARFIAIIGMVMIHIIDPPQFDLLNLGTILGFFHGRAAALFGVLAGVSAGLMARRALATGGLSQAQLYLQMVARAVLIFLLGCFLMEIHYLIAIILPIYAAVLLGVIPLLRATWPTLLFWLAGGVLVSAMVSAMNTGLFPYADSPIGQMILGQPYPLITWWSYGVFGLLLTRLNLSALSTQWRMLGIATGPFILTLVLMYILANWLFHVGPAAHYYPWEYDVGATMSPMSIILGVFSGFFSFLPHSGGLLDIIGNMAGSAMILAICLLVAGLFSRAELTRRIIWPFLVAGAMPLTIYTAHVVSFAVYTSSLRIPFLQEPILYESDYDQDFLDFQMFNETGTGPAVYTDEEPGTVGFGWENYSPMETASWSDWIFFLATVVVAVAFAALWRWKLRRGPLEMLVGRGAQRLVPNPQPIVLRGTAGVPAAQQQLQPTQPQGQLPHTQPPQAEPPQRL